MRVRAGCGLRARIERSLPRCAPRALLARRAPRMPGHAPGVSDGQQLSHCRPAWRRHRARDHAALPRADGARGHSRAGGPGLRFETLPGGAGHYRDTGLSMPKETRVAAARADAILLCAMGLPEVRYPDGREITPQIELRFEFGLYAGVRPVRPIPGVRPVLADPRAHDIDYVIVRESTEGLFAPQAPGEIIEDREARETLVLTRPTCEKLYDFCFRLAAERAGRPAAQGHACRQGQRLCGLSLGARHLLRARAGLSGDRRRPRLCRRLRHAHGATALGRSTSPSPRTCSATSSRTSAQL